MTDQYERIQYFKHPRASLHHKQPRCRLAPTHAVVVKINESIYVLSYYQASINYGPLHHEVIQRATGGRTVIADAQHIQGFSRCYAVVLLDCVPKTVVERVLIKQ